MRKRKLKEVEVEISSENYKKLNKVGRKANLKWEKVVDMILTCEVDILRHILSERTKLAKKLKVKPTGQFLFHKGLLK